MAKNDDVIKDLLATIETQTTALGKAPRGTWLTNGVFKYNPEQGSRYFNINVVQDFTVIAHAMGFLMSRCRSFVEGCEELGIKAEFKWDGYYVEEWKTDFKMRISMIEYAKKKKMLEATKAKLHTLVSEKTRTELELVEIAKALKE